MKLGFLKEVYVHESRVAITPEVAKKLGEFGYEINFEKDAGLSSGFTNEIYLKNNAAIEKTREKILSESDLIITVSPLSAADVALIKKSAILVGMLKPFKHGELFESYNANQISAFSLELIPRITRAQTMDVLSSQSNLAGYRSVIEGAHFFGRALPLMMTAAGTIQAAKVLVLGAGVAGLQAIATAKRLGAIVSAFDVRSAAKEQVQSLGASFVEVSASEVGDGAGG